MRGIFTALMCSFDEKGQVNENGLREIVRYNIGRSKVDGLYVNGSAGENFLISTEQKKQKGPLGTVWCASHRPELR